MTLAHRLLGQPARLRLATTFRLFSGRHTQRRLQGCLFTSFDKVADADSKTSGQEPQRLQRWITQSPFQLGEESWRNDVAGSVDLGDPLIHRARRTLAPTSFRNRLKSTKQAELEQSF